MGKEIGSLAVKLSATSAGLDADLKRATAKIEAFGKNVTSGLRAPGSIFGAITNPLASIPMVGGALAGALSAASLQESLNGIVALNKEAEKLGFTVSELSRLMLLADPSSFSEEAMLTGLRKMTLAAQEALDPSSEAGKKFGMFGLDPEAMLRGGGLESLKLFADRMKALQSPSERLEFASIMGKGGHELIAFLKDGAAGLDEMNSALSRSQEVRESEAKAALEGIKAIDSVGDAWTRFKQTLAITAVKEGQKAAGTFEWFSKNLPIALNSLPRGFLPPGFQGSGGTSRDLGGDFITTDEIKRRQSERDREVNVKKEQMQMDALARAELESVHEFLAAEDATARRRRAFAERVVGRARDMAGDNIGSAAADVFGSQGALAAIASFESQSGKADGASLLEESIQIEKRIAEAAEKLLDQAIRSPTVAGMTFSK